MYYLKKIYNFYIFGNIHVALAGFCLTKITLLNHNFSSNLSPLFVALGIVVSYNFIRFYEIKTNQLSWLKQWFVKHKKSLHTLSFLSALLMLILYFSPNFNSNAIWVLLPFAFMTFFYVIPIFKIGKLEFSFRNFPGLKIFSISFAWAGITVFFPLKEVMFSINTIIFIEFIQRFFILMAITLPFDIRDVDFDSKSLKTLPQVLGIKLTKIMGSVFLILFVLLSVFVRNNLFISVGIAIITGFFLWFSSPKKSRYYTAFWVEAIPIFWILLIILFL